MPDRSPLAMSDPAPAQPDPAPLLTAPPAKSGRPQTCTARAWISRARSGDVFQSHVSLGKGKVRTRSTATKVRATALDFNRHHLLELLRASMNFKPPTPVETPMEQPELEIPPGDTSRG